MNHQFATSALTFACPCPREEGSAKAKEGVAPPSLPGSTHCVCRRSVGTVCLGIFIEGSERVSHLSQAAQQIKWRY